MRRGVWVKSGWGFRFSIVCALNMFVLLGGYASFCMGIGGVFPSFKALLIMGLGICMASATVAFAAYWTFVRPLRHATEAMDALVAKRRSMTCSLPGGDLVGGLGDLIRSTNRFFTILAREIRQIKGDAATIHVSSGVMHQLAEDILSRCSSTVLCTSAASSAGSQVGVNMEAVSTAVEEASMGVTVVASSAEEMSVTISEIAQNTEEARRVAEEAVTRSQEVATCMGALTQAAGHINHVTQTIDDISRETNLLALNATIEAARAGEAGQGFAVVANEIKALAGQTSEATATIKGMLGTIEASIESSEAAISEISEVITQVRDNAHSISTAVHQQSMASHGIAASTTQASGSIADISRSTADTSAAISVLAQDIAGISNDSSGISFGMLETKINIEELATLAGNLDAASSSIDVGTALFHIGEVKVAHMGWRTVLESVLAGVRTLDPSEVVSHTECNFGQWYFGSGRDFAAIPAYQEMGIWHEKVHSVAREIVVLFNAGEKEAARRRMDAFVEAKEMMFSLLDELYLCDLKVAS